MDRHLKRSRGLFHMNSRQCAEVGDAAEMTCVAGGLMSSQVCEPWCSSKCAELNGNVAQECGGCTSASRCAPGAADWPSSSSVGPDRPRLSELVAAEVAPRGGAKPAAPRRRPTGRAAGHVSPRLPDARYPRQLYHLSLIHI